MSHRKTLTEERAEKAEACVRELEEQYEGVCRERDEFIASYEHEIKGLKEQLENLRVEADTFQQAAQWHAENAGKHEAESTRLKEQVQTAQEELEAIRDLAITRGYKLDDLKEQLEALREALDKIERSAAFGSFIKRTAQEALAASSPASRQDA